MLQIFADSMMVATKADTKALSNKTSSTTDRTSARGGRWSSVRTLIGFGGQIRAKG